MDNTNIILAANIQKYRKKAGLTQEGLAQKLGVTFQAVSKWENAKSAPDILFLPILADLFNCYIDELFSRDINAENHYAHCDELPWNDDEVIRILQTKGKKILKVQENNSYIDVAFPKDCNETTRQYFKVEILGNLACDSCINGDVVCQGNIDCADTNGNVQCGGYVECRDVGDNVTAGQYVECGDVGDNVIAGQYVECGDVGDNVTAGQFVECGDICGDIESQGDVNCNGNIDAKNIICKSINCSGDINCDKITHKM